MTDDRILRQAEVCRIIGLQRTTLVEKLRRRSRDVAA